MSFEDAVARTVQLLGLAKANGTTSNSSIEHVMFVCVLYLASWLACRTFSLVVLALLLFVEMAQQHGLRGSLIIA